MMSINELGDSIDLLYKGGYTAKEGEQISKECLNYITDHKDDFEGHFFCKDNIHKISTLSLTRLSYETDGKIEILLQTLNDSLFNCHSCLIKFYNERVNLYYYLSTILKMNHGNIEKFFDSIDTWRADTYKKFDDLTNIEVTKVTTVTFPKKDDDIIILDNDIESDDEEQIIETNKPTLNINQKFLVSEMLLNPNLLKNMFELKFTFMNIIEKAPDCIIENELIIKNHLTPMVINQFFITNDVNHWSFKLIRDLVERDNLKLNADNCEIINQIVLEIIFQSMRLTTLLISTKDYYFKMSCILMLLSTEQIKEITNIKQVKSIYKQYPEYKAFLPQLITDLNAASSSKSDYIHVLLRTLNLVFSVYEKDAIWKDVLKNYNITHFIAILKESDKKMMLKEKILISQDNYKINYLNFNPNLNDFVLWIDTFYNSLSKSLDQKSFSRSFVNFVLKFVSESTQLTPIAKGLLTSAGCVYLNKLLSIDDETVTGNNDLNLLQNKLTDVIGYRGVINKPDFLKSLIEFSLKCKRTIVVNDDDLIKKISEPIFNLLLTCFQIDLNSYLLKIGQLQEDQKSVKSTDIPTFNSAVYDGIIEGLNFYSLSESQKVIFTSKLFKYLRDIHLVVNLSNYTSITPQNIEIINTNVSQLMRKITTVISKIEADDYGFFSKALTNNKDSLYGFWSCMFSDNRQLYSKIVGLLYSCFDEEDRIQNFLMILDTDIKNNFETLSKILKNLCHKQLFEPCHYGMTVLEDLMDATVLLIKKHFFKENKFILDFWNQFWIFIKLLYSSAYKWSAILKIDILLEFCKTVMDLNKLAIESVSWFEKLIDNQKKDLFLAPIIDVLPMLPPWLKLNDEPLVDQCINLLIYTLNMAYGNWSVNIKNTVIYEIFSVANKKDPLTGKVKKTLTNDEQRKKLIDCIYEINPTYTKELSDKLTKFAVVDITKIKSEPIKMRTSRISMDISGLSNTKSKFGKLTLSSKDKAEEQLKKARAKSERIIHPPSAGGFNDFGSRNKPPVELSSSSDDDDDDSSVDEIKAMFGITKGDESNKSKSTVKKKKEGITMVDEFGNEIIKASRKKEISIEELQKKEKMKLEKRLKVNVNPFFEEILQWDYKRTGDFPYDNFKYENTKQQYSSSEEYQKIMGPLLLLETWEQINKAKTMDSSSKVITIDVTNRVTVGRFFLIYATVPAKLWENGGFTEADLCGIGTNKRSSAAALPNSSRSFELLDIVNYAKIDEVKNTRGDMKEVSIKVSLKSKIGEILSPGTTVLLTKLTSLMTSEREYTTLYGLQDYNLLKNLMIPKVTNISKTIKPDDVLKIRKQYDVNQSQAEAIACVTTSSGISLIQGPPGTGKSKTIVSMMKFFFSQKDSTKVLNFKEMPTSNKKILLCAPSNAAIDELMVRLSAATDLKLVRIGRKDAVNSKVQHLVLSEQIEGKLKKPELITIDHEKYQQEIKRRNGIRDKLEVIKNDPKNSENSDMQKTLNLLRVELTQCNETLNIMRKERDSIRETNNIFRRKSEFEKKNLTQRILNEADIVCTTLSGSAQKQLENLGLFFPTVVIDEACQCTELSTLVPLRYGAKQIIMVGDPNQLPPTVISNVASGANYDESLFSRLIKGNVPYLLDVQYRMHPEISKFPSKQFYKSKLKDGPNMDTMNYKPWFKDPIFKPYNFFSVVDGRESKSAAMSLSNTIEAEFVVKLVETLLNRYSNEYEKGIDGKMKKISFKNQIGVVSPYKEQVRLIRNLFERKFGSMISQTVAVETVDSFQGQEKAIMIFSCVRSSDTSTSIGFLKDYRRLNVALTRGKSNMWIVGNSNMLIKDKLWGSLIRDAEERGAVVNGGEAIFKNPKSYQIREVKKSDDDYEIPKSKPKITKRKLDDSSSSGVDSNAKKVKKTSLTNNKNPLSDASKEKTIDQSKVPGIYIHDSSSSLKKQEEKENIHHSGNKNYGRSILKTSKAYVKGNKLPAKKVMFNDNKDIKFYTRESYEDEYMGDIYQEHNDVSNNYKNLDIDGHVIKKKDSTISKGKMDIGNYKKMKEERKKNEEMKTQRSIDDEEEDDDYQPLKKQKVAPAFTSHKENDEDEDDDYKISVPSKSAKSTVKQDDDDDEYQIPVKKSSTKKKPSAGKTKKSSPFMTDPYKHMKTKKKKTLK
ncbi:putative DNA/RNA helicase [Hanseniaspora uvarum]|nr:putative DNA/RNA helicase [Hanseniaspora uvarum]